MPRFRVHSLVESEFNEARAWYADRSQSAAENFAGRFDRSLARVESHPTSHAPWMSIFRRTRVKYFPYLILFHTNRRITSVLALVHERRAAENVLTTVGRRLTQFA
jgi:plasmid stabilization system protein ParE